ncbi:hypothetical protein [Piscinibacter sp. XHJ-5]|uniref:hypothetical protein n=1 Tax=Piscinibacter sp. XHJ-5 TaxID=3037797 RepID=UPI002452EE1D|nr:hypothetical protein [Piscinibacter sp. XHJ-5]
MNPRPPKPPDGTPAQRYGLFIAALVVALLGLTTLDVSSDETRAAKRKSAEHERTAECIVASALFVGVRPTP